MDRGAGTGKGDSWLAEDEWTTNGKKERAPQRRFQEDGSGADDGEELGSGVRVKAVHLVPKHEQRTGSPARHPVVPKLCYPSAQICRPI